ncbi:MAG: glycosyltransferase family 4 protein, partial [Bacteroidota bacterium]
LFNLRSSDIVVCQFAGYHSFFPVLLSRWFGKPSLIVAGGTDCVSFPSIRYGNFNKKYLSWFTRWSFMNATHITPVHESLVFSEYVYHDNDHKFQGVKAFCPDITTPFTVIPNGYDSGRWQRVAEPRRGTFITVTADMGFAFIKALKGIDLIIEVAPHFPQCEFIIIGADPDKDLGERSGNVTKIPYVKNEDLSRYYSNAQFYLQLSISEGFPNALCEAMLCGCVPVVSRVASMPEIVGESGYILDRRDMGELIILLKAALADPEAGKRSIMARRQIAGTYTENKRRTGLNTLVRELIEKSRSGLI